MDCRTPDSWVDLRVFVWLSSAAALTLTAACAIGVAWGLTRIAVSRWGSRILAGIGLIVLLAGAFPAVAGYRERALRLGSDSRAIHKINVAAGEWIAANPPPTR